MVLPLTTPHLESTAQLLKLNDSTGQREKCLVSHGRGGRLIEGIQPTRPDKCCIHDRMKCMLGQSEPIAFNIGDKVLTCTPPPTQTVNFSHNLHKL